MDNPKRKGSRMYSIKMTWSLDEPAYEDPLVLKAGVTYKAAIQFLNDLQKVWSKRGIPNVREAHNRLTIHKLEVWFEEEKTNEKE